MSRLQCLLNALDSKVKSVWIVQFIKFGLVGVTNTVISYGIYAFLVWTDFYYIFSSIVAFVISVAWSYLLNSFFVFKKHEGEHRVWWKVLIKTYASYALTGLLINNILLYVWVDTLKINEYLAYLISLGITVPFNFILNKFWAFTYKTRKQ